MQGYFIFRFSQWLFSMEFLHLLIKRRQSGLVICREFSINSSGMNRLDSEGLWAWPYLSTSTSQGDSTGHPIFLVLVASSIRIYIILLHKMSRASQLKKTTKKSPLVSYITAKEITNHTEIFHCRLYFL